MLLDSVIRRRLLSSLSPWLRELPELELNVVIVQSQAIAKNLQFDSAALNALLGGSSNFSFEELTVGEFSIRFWNWPVHSFTIEVRDVNVVLSVRWTPRLLQSWLRFFLVWGFFTMGCIFQILKKRERERA